MQPTRSVRAVRERGRESERENRKKRQDEAETDEATKEDDECFVTVVTSVGATHKYKHV